MPIQGKKTRAKGPRYPKHIIERISDEPDLEEELSSEEHLEQIKEDVEDIKEEVIDSGKEVEELREDVEEIKEDVEEITKAHRSLLKRISDRISDQIHERIHPDKFEFDDFAQQVVGAIILSAPLTVTQEVWMLSQSLDISRVGVIFALTLTFDLLLIYYAKFQQTSDERIFGIIPKRLLSLLIVSYCTAFAMLYILGVTGGQVNDVEGVIKLVVFVGLFANIGAGAADMLK